MTNHSQYHIWMLLPFLSLILLITACSQEKSASISEEIQTLETYPFYDPSPVPSLAAQRGRIYPYNQFNGYSEESIDEDWTVLTLENDFIEVTVLPEVGGKLWGAIEKSTGLEFIYKNKVKKFRNIGIRGPWTSGGIEFNFGTAGHTPATATPVDYIIRENDDGSVSAIVGTIDLPSRTEWRVNITVPADKAYFETESFWFNTTPLRQFNYVWMNAAIRAADDLQFFFPGTHHLGHPGDAHAWPIDDEGRDLTWYVNNDFEGSKSYHILGEKEEYFGAYWHDDEFGFGNWSLYSDMPGKKLWIWALARSGGIWEDLLTDTDGQYVEVQSGRYFSQALGRSPETPFNHGTIDPSMTDTWNEAWFPVKKIGGITAASPHAVLNHEQRNGYSVIQLMALQRLNDDLVISADGTQLKSTTITLAPLETYTDSIEIATDFDNLQAILGDYKLIYNSNKEHLELHRPVENDLQRNLDTAARNYHRGLNQLASRNYSSALDNFLSVIEEDPAFTSAYINLADLYYRRGEYDRALEYAKEALSHNTYNDDANFIYGIIQKRLGNNIQAIEAFGWAARSMKYRSSAYDMMSQLYLNMERTDMAIEYARRSLVYNQKNINGLKALAVSYRKNQDHQKAQQVLDTLLELDPLSHFARFERYLLNGNQRNLNEFNSMIRHELPHETYLELAIYYHKAGLLDNAIEVLRHAPQYATVDYWLAYLHKDLNEEESTRYLNQALDASPRFVFPFRLETIPVIEWAKEQSSSWKNNYYLGLIYRHIGQEQTALDLFNQADDASDYSPFYIVRAELRNNLDVSTDLVYEDLKKANDLGQDEWRTWNALHRYYMNDASIENALEISSAAIERFPDQDAIKMDYARSLLANGQFEANLNHLDEIVILPFEDAREGRDIFEITNILHAASLIENNQPEEAQHYLVRSLEWPENLGVGRPYDPDHRFQQYVNAMIYKTEGNEARANEIFEDIIEYTEAFPSRWGNGHFAGILALRETGHTEDARRLLDEWRNAQTDNLLSQWAAAVFNQNTAQQNRLAQQILQDDPTNSSFSAMTVKTIQSLNRL